MKFPNFFWVIIFTNISLFSMNNFNVEGRIVDSKTKEGIENVNIFVEDLGVGTASSLDGYFNIKIDSFESQVTLFINHIGFKSKKIIVSNINKELLIELDESFFEMDELVITGTKTSKIRENVPISTQIITNQEILNSGESNIAELLSSFSGVNLQTSVDGGSILNIMGMDSRYILILLDGQPITGKFNNRVSLDQISTKLIDKIEISKGPSSSLYGTEAMSGVINIISNKNLNEDLISASVRFSDSEKNLNFSDLVKGSFFRNFVFKKNTSKLSSSINLNSDKIETDKTIQQIDADNILKNSGLFKLDYRFNNKHSISFSSNIFHQTENGESSLMNTKTNIFRNLFNLKHNFYTKNNWIIDQIIQKQSYERNYMQNRPWGDQVKNDLTSEENLEYEIKFTKKSKLNIINFGLESSKSIYQSDRVQNDIQSVLNNSFFLQYEYHYKNGLSVIYGARTDFFSEYQEVFSPRIGILYSIKSNWKIRTSWGRGFRSPSFMERFIDWDHIQFGYKVLGNPNLKPESSIGYSFEIENYKLSKYQTSIRLYHTGFDNLIEDYAISPGILSYRNVVNATYSGIEINGKWNTYKSLLFSWGLNFVNNRDEEKKIIPNTQPVSGNLGIVFNYKTNSLRLNLKWIGKYYPQDYDPLVGIYIKSKNSLPNQYLININQNFLLFNNIKLILGIKNSLNYTNIRYGPFVGRVFFAEISNNF